MSANSFHHQAAKRLGRDLLPMAYADDGVIEGFYHGTHPYLRAYQWHPERLFGHNAHNRLVFQDFIKHCCK
jgi:putative glutamine amidotransferase